ITDTWGKGAVVGMMGSGDFIGKGGLAGQPKRMATATAVENPTGIMTDEGAGTPGRPPPLHSEEFLHFADFLADFPADPFALAFGLQVGLVRRPANLLLNFAFQLVKLSLGSVSGASLHGCPSPFGQLGLRVVATSHLA